MCHISQNNVVLKTERSGKAGLKRTMQMEVPGNELLTGRVRAKPMAHSIAHRPSQFRRVQFKSGGSYNRY